MKKLICVLLAILICGCMLFSCDANKNLEEEKTPLEELQGAIAAAGCQIGIAFLGYVDDYIEGCSPDEVKEIFSESLTGEKYPSFEDSHFVDHDGDGLFLLVPSSKNAKICIHEGYIMLDIGPGMEFEQYALIYEGEAGEPVIMRGNTWDSGRSNVLARVQLKGYEFEFSPAIDINTNRLAEEEGCYDFTVYDPEDTREEFLEDAYNTLLDTDMVKEYINEGMVLVFNEDTEMIDGKECFEFSVCTEHEAGYVRRHFFAVSYDGDIYSTDHTVIGEWVKIE